MANVTVIPAVNDNVSLQKLRCAAYCRVSSNSEDQLHSYTAQVKFYSEMFKDSEIQMLVDIYADEGITGTCENKRPEFQRLIKDCKRGKIDRIYTKSISRFARNTKDCLKNIRELSSLGISIFFEKENIDTANIADEMIITLMGGLAQEESTSISQNMRWSIHRRMKEGTFEPSTVPYGYDKVDGNLVVNEAEAAVIRMIYNMYLNGTGISRIAIYLNEKGIKTKMHNKQWCASSVSYILTNEKYTGNSLLQKRYSTETVPIQLKRNNGEKPKYYVENSHESIISQEMFDNVQAILQGRRKWFYYCKSKSIMSGYIKCGYCGDSCRHKKCSGKYYWSCKKHDIRADFCMMKPIPDESVIQAFIRLSNKLKLHYRDILLPLQKELHELNDKKFSDNTRIIDIRKEKVMIREQRYVLSRLRTKGFLDEKKYNEQMLILENRRLKLDQELSKLFRANAEDEMIEQLDTLIDCIEYSKLSSKFDDELFGMIIEKIIINEEYLEFNLISGLKFREKI